MKDIAKNIVLSAMFLAGAFINAIPGIIVLIPVIMLALGRTGLVPFKASRGTQNEKAGN